MQQVEATCTDTKDLLSSTVFAPHQIYATDVKYPCTGFCYYAVENKDAILQKYKSREDTGICREYFDLIKTLIIDAGRRKINSKDIQQDGEFIDQDTIKKDFPDIINRMEFTEIACPDAESFAIAQNDIFVILLTVDIGGFVMITRSHETFVMFKLDADTFFVVDSHNVVHGTISIEKATHYILRSGVYKGLVQMGYSIEKN